MSETPLAPDSQQFKLFEDACRKKETVRIRYMQWLPEEDESLPEELRKQGGIPTIVEGNAVRLDPIHIMFRQSVGKDEEVDPDVRTIERSAVLEISVVGKMSEPKLEQEVEDKLTR